PYTTLFRSDAGHQRAVLIGARIGVAHERRGDPISQRSGGGANEDELAAEFLGRHAPREYVGEAVSYRTEGSRRADVVEVHAAAVQHARGYRIGRGRDDGHRGRRRVEPDGARAYQKRVLQIGDAFLWRAVGNPYGLHRHRTVRTAVIVGQADGHLTHDAVQFGLRVHVPHTGGGAFDPGQRLQPARRSAVHRGIDELRRHYHVPGTSDGACQGVVVFLRGGVGEEDVQRNDCGLGGGQRVDGAGDHLARPREASEAGHAGLVDGHHRDLFGNR